MGQTMLLSERVAQVAAAEHRIERLSARVQGMMLLGQDRDVKGLAVALAREANRLNALFTATQLSAAPRS